MSKRIAVAAAAIIVLTQISVFANSAPVVSNVSVAQRGDESKLVDIHYDLADADGDSCTVWVVVSDNGGANWRVPARTFTGDIGNSIVPGTTKSVVWDAGADMPGKVGTYKVRVYADDGEGPDAMVLVPTGWFPYQNVSEPEDWIFVDPFLIDKYECTVGFYCQFLNSDDPDADHWTAEMEIDRLGDPGNYYYTVHPDKENYPIRYVSLYDAEAFAAWRSALEGKNYRLPTEQEWEKAAGWDPAEEHYYMYGFHSDTIDCSWCNYNNCVGVPTEVGHYDGTDGTQDAKSYYGCYDMSGNVFEWTSSIYSVSYRVIRGGGWIYYEYYCRVSYRYDLNPSVRSYCLGFRLALDFD